MTDSAQNSKQILAQKGTAGTPSHSFLGGNATGMYLAGTNQLGFSTAGALAAVIDASGNVGIGVLPSAWAATSYALQVGSGASMFSNNVAYSYFSTNGYFDGTNWRYIGTGASAQYVQSAGANIWYYAASGTAGNTFAWQEAMRIDASGNVGIGTGSPATKLTVQTSALGDAIRWTDNINSTGILATASGVSTMWTTTALGFGTGGGTYTERMRIDASGNVGIGTGPGETIGATLEVRGAVGTALRIRSILNSVEPTGYYSIGRDTTDGLLKFNGAQTTFVGYKFLNTGSEVMRIDSNGNVGIGTASPGAKLQVSGSTVSNNFAFGTTTAGAGQIASDTGYAGARIVFYGSTSGGSGTLDIYAGATAPIQFSTNGSERMRIDSNGDMQVGTTSNINNARISVQNSLNCYVAYTTNNSYTTFQGFGAAGTGSSTFYVLGSGQIYSTSTSIIAISDQTLKANIKPLETGLAEVLALKPRRFDWSEKSINEGRNIAGFIAQEVQAVLPDLIAPYQYGKDETKLGLKMGDMIPTLVAAIQELAAKVAALEGK